MDIQHIRKDFPLLQDDTGKKPLVYLDTACQSLRPTPVIETIQKYYTDLNACSGRSMHRLAEQVTHEVDSARATLAKFLGAGKADEVVFTRNTTEGINLVANSIDLKPGDGVLISDKEHNSNLIPWQMLVKRKGIRLIVTPSCPNNTFDLPAFKNHLDGSVKLVALGYTSNLDGVTIPAPEIIKTAHKNGSLVFLDAAQTAPHQSINVKALDVDFLALSGHKMLGPSGTGVLYGKYKLLEKLEPFLVGGDTVSSSTYETCEFLPPPEKFEAGLQNYAGIMGLATAARYLTSIGFDFIKKQERLVNQALSAAITEIPGIHLIGPSDPNLRGGICSFYIDGVDSHRIALMLNQMAGIMVRSGQHCVHSWFHSRNVIGSVRASAYFYNTPQEAAYFVENLMKIRKVL